MRRPRPSSPWCARPVVSAAAAASAVDAAPATIGVRVADAGEGWTWARSQVYLEAEAPRVGNCPEHGVTVSAVPWARHGSRFTRAFEDQAGWLVTHTSRSAVSS